MKLFKLKRKNIILVSLLAIAGFLGISSVAVNQAVKDTPVAEKAEADDASCRLYLNPGVWDKDGAWFALYDMTNGDVWIKMKKISVTNGSSSSNYYVAESSNSITSCIFCRMNASKTALDWSSRDNQTSDINNASNGKVCNISGLNNTDWGWDSNTVNTLTINSLVGSTAYDVGKDWIYIWNSCTWTAPDQDNRAGYEKSGWYKSNKTTSFTSFTVTSDQIVYSKYTALSLYFYVDNSGGNSGSQSTQLTRQSITFGASTCNYSETISLAAGKSFIIRNSGGGVKYGCYASDTTGAYLYNQLNGSYPISCFRYDTGQEYIKVNVSGSYSFDIDITTSGQMTINSVTRSPSGTKTVTYHKIIDGTDTNLGQVTLWNEYVYNADSTKIQADVFGYYESHWYTQPVINEYYKYTDGTSITENINLYQIYTKLEYAMYYFEVDNADDSWNTSVKLHAWQTIGSTNTAWSEDITCYPFYKEAGTAVVYNAYLPVPTASVTTKAMLYVDGKGQTDDIVLSSDLDEMCWQIESFSNTYHGSWKYFEAGYKLKDTSNNVIKDLTKNVNGSNLAYGTDVVFDSVKSLKIVVSITIGSAASTDTEYYTLGTDEPPEAAHRTTDYATQGATYFTLKTTGTYNFYVNQYHNIYITDSSVISSAGTLYVSNSLNWTNIYVYTETSSSKKPLGNWPGTLISNIDSTTFTVTLDYEGHGTLYKVIVNDLSGTEASRATLLVLNDGTEGTYDAAEVGVNKTEDIAIGDASNSPNYYVDTGSDVTSLVGTESSAVAPKFAYDLDAAIRSATNSSVCNLSSDTLSTLSTGYTSSVASSLSNSTITTYDGSLWNGSPVYEGEETYSVSEIMSQVNRLIPSRGRNGGVMGLGNLFGSEDNFSTIIIIISSSVALLSVTALSILVIRKRKSKED